MDISKLLKKWAGIKQAEKALASGLKGGFHPELLSDEVKKARGLLSDSEPTLIIPDEGISKELLQSRLKNLEDEIPVHERLLRDNPDLQKFQKDLDADKMLTDARREDLIKKMGLDKNKAAGLAALAAMGGTALNPEEAEAGGFSLKRTEIKKIINPLKKLGRPVTDMDIAKAFEFRKNKISGTDTKNIRNSVGHLLLENSGLNETVENALKAAKGDIPGSSAIPIEFGPLKDGNLGVYKPNILANPRTLDPQSTPEIILNKDYLNNSDILGLTNMTSHELGHFGDDVIYNLSKPKYKTVPFNKVNYNVFPADGRLVDTVLESPELLKELSGMYGVDLSKLSKKELKSIFKPYNSVSEAIASAKKAGAPEISEPSGLTEILKDPENTRSLYPLSSTNELHPFYAQTVGHHYRRPLNYEMEKLVDMINGVPEQSLVEPIQKQVDKGNLYLPGLDKSDIGKIAAGLGGAAVLGGAALSSDDAEAAAPGSKAAREAFKNTPGIGKIFSNWIMGANPAAREKIANIELPKEARNEMIRRLTPQTKTRRNPETGEVEFLLHRGGGGYTGPDVRSWTTSPDIAESFAAQHGKDTVQSAWVPESQIKNYPNMLGKPQVFGDKGEFSRASNPLREEQEVIASVHPKNVSETRKLEREADKLDDADVDEFFKGHKVAGLGGAAVLGGAALGSKSAEASVPKESLKKGPNYGGQESKFLKYPHEEEEGLEGVWYDPVELAGFGAPGVVGKIGKIAASKLPIELAKGMGHQLPGLAKFEAALGAVGEGLKHLPHVKSYMEENTPLDAVKQSARGLFPQMASMLDNQDSSPKSVLDQIKENDRKKKEQEIPE